jgi:hypothetical protein
VITRRRAARWRGEVDVLTGRRDMVDPNGVNPAASAGYHDRRRGGDVGAAWAERPP